MKSSEPLKGSKSTYKNSKYGEINIAVISNISFEPYFASLLKNYFTKSDLKINLHNVPYDGYDATEYKNKLISSDGIIIFLNIELLFPDVWNIISAMKKSEYQVIDEISVLCRKLYNDISSYSKAKILWFLFEDYFMKFSAVMGYYPFCSGLIDRLNVKLCCEMDKSISFIDLKRLIAEVGVTNAYDLKGKYRWNAPYSKVLIKAVVGEIYKQYLIEKGITKKCLVIDCDNVLWGGILSEDGIEDIKLGSNGFGRAYQDFQRFVLTLYYHGVILAVCSKNDLSDVMTMFHKHSEMILKEEHIACFQVNWDNKPDNIRKIAETFNISLDSIVFVDDSPAEIEDVRAMLPEVKAILYDRDTVYEQLSCFNLQRGVNIADIRKRNETYRTNQLRDKLKSQYKDYSEYISALNIRVDIHEAVPIEFSRISELTQRTNKCTNGNRYSVAEIIARVNAQKSKLYSVSVADRFSDLGLIGALEVSEDILTLFSLSCRALGRNIEKQMISFLLDRHKISGIVFHDTGKNEDFKALLTEEFPQSTFL